jgi:hypothetical protein
MNCRIFYFKSTTTNGGGAHSTFGQNFSTRDILAYRNGPGPGKLCLNNTGYHNPANTCAPNDRGNNSVRRDTGSPQYPGRD